MHLDIHRAALWTKGLKAAIGFLLALLLLLLINLFVYQKMRLLTETCQEPPQANELLRVLVVTDLLAVVFLSGLVLLLNRQLTLRDAAERTAQEAQDAQEASLRERVAELTSLCQTLQREASDRRRLEGQLKYLQKMESLGKLVGSVSHEFNNYLTVILGFSEQLLQQIPPGTMEYTTIAEIYKAGERSAELTRGLLGLVRTGEGAPRPIDLNRQVDELRRMLQVMVSKRVHLEIVLQGGSLFVQAVPGQIEQVLLNLAANARDAMPQGGLLSITTETVNLDAPRDGMPPGRYVVLRVADTGCGLSDEARRRMFEPFYTTKERGTGLGLATVREIVTGSGGYIVADSTPAQGALFRVFWPLRAASAERDTVVCPVLRGEQDTRSG